MYRPVSFLSLTALTGLALAAACGGPAVEEGLTPEAVVIEGDAVLSADWELVADAELEQARAEDGPSLRAALGAEAIFVNGGKVYRLKDASVLNMQTLPGYRGVSALEGPEDSVALADQAIIVGQDNRQPITSGLTSVPQRQVGRLTTGVTLNGTFTTLNGLAGGGCTGTKIGWRGVLTSGHCFKSLTNTVRFEPAVSGPTSPYATLTSQTFYVFGTGATDDYALVILPATRAVYALGFIGLYAPPSSFEGKEVAIRGYPGGNQICWTAPTASFPLCGGYMYRSVCDLTQVSQEIEYPCDTSPGMSGSGVMTMVNGTRRVIGVHKGEDDDVFDNENRGVRMTNFKVTFLCALMGNFGGGCN